MHHSIVPVAFDWMLDAMGWSVIVPFSDLETLQKITRCCVVGQHYVLQRIVSTGEHTRTNGGRNILGPSFIRQLSIVLRWDYISG